MHLFHRQFRFSWPALLLAILVIGTGLGLGFWQLDRAREKSELLAEIRERGRQPPRSVDQLLNSKSPGNYPVRAQGRFDQQRHFLLDNRMLEGRAGYHLLTPLVTANGHWVLVNRGWLARGPNRETLPDIPELDGEVEVRGRAYVPSERAMVLREDKPGGENWPVRIQKVDMQTLGGLLGVELAPFEIRVAPDFALERGEQLPRVWHDSRLGPERHHAYALQWFALAAAALVVFIVAGLSRPGTDKRND